MTTARRLGLVGIGLAATAVLAAGGPATASRGVWWEGAESFSPVRLGPNPDRCGHPPANIEAEFAGSGIDTAGGAFTVTASGCLDTDTFRVSDLKATDTFVGTSDRVHIVTDDFTMDLDASTCVLTNRRPVRFRVAGGDGGLEGATGRGVFDMALNWPGCNGRTLPAHVWFKGRLHDPR